MKRPGSTLSRRWRRYWALPRSERKLFRLAWWALLAADLALRFAQRRTLERAMGDAPATAPPGSRAPLPAPTTDPSKVAQAIRSAAANHLWPMTCLPRAIALRRLLLARGLAARIEIGVRKERGSLVAHAWVEVGGAPVGETEAIEQRFLPLLSARTTDAPSS